MINTDSVKRLCTVRSLNKWKVYCITYLHKPCVHEESQRVQPPLVQSIGTQSCAKKTRSRSHAHRISYYICPVTHTHTHLGQYWISPWVWRLVWWVFSAGSGPCNVWTQGRDGSAWGDTSRRITSHGSSLLTILNRGGKKWICVGACNFKNRFFSPELIYFHLFFHSSPDGDVNIIPTSRKKQKRCTEVSRGGSWNTLPRQPQLDMTKAVCNSVMHSYRIAATKPTWALILSSPSGVKKGASWTTSDGRPTNAGWDTEWTPKQFRKSKTNHRDNCPFYLQRPPPI